jgi:hypothetical protein
MAENSFVFMTESQGKDASPGSLHIYRWGYISITLFLLRIYVDMYKPGTTGM